MNEIVVVGIGNEYRGDDAVGWAVANALESKANGKVRVSKQRGDIAELIDIFANTAHVYIVDACLSDATAGTWQRIDALREPLPAEQAQTSTHGFSIHQAIDLARSLDQLPDQLIVYAVAGSRFTINDTMSPNVARSVADVVQAILQEEDIQACMNKA